MHLLLRAHRIASVLYSRWALRTSGERTGSGAVERGEKGKPMVKSIGSGRGAWVRVGGLLVAGGGGGGGAPPFWWPGGGVGAWRLPPSRRRRPPPPRNPRRRCARRRRTTPSTASGSRTSSRSPSGATWI